MTDLSSLSLGDLNNLMVLAAQARKGLVDAERERIGTMLADAAADIIDTHGDATVAESGTTYWSAIGDVTIDGRVCTVTLNIKDVKASEVNKAAVKAAATAKAATPAPAEAPVEEPAKG